MPELPIRAGRVRQYETRPGEEASRLVILKVEHSDHAGEIVHVAIDGLRLKNGSSPEGESRRIDHLPFAGDALRGSLRAIAAEDAELPAFQDGCTEWKAAFDAGRGGVWTASVAETLAALESAMAEGDT